MLLHDQLHSERTQRDKLATATTRRVPPAQLALDLDNKPARAVEAPEYSPLEAPRLPFSSRGYGRASPTSSARTSSSSLSSLASSSGSRRYSAGRSDLTAQQSQQQQQRVGLGYHSPGASPSDSVQSLPRVDEDMAGFNTYDDHDGAAQEELLDESERPSHHPKQNGNLDPYAWERPLDAVNRHSRQLDVAPAPQNVRDSRRLSRLPPGLTMVDPFGFNVAAETSPYDLALTASQAPATTALSTSAPTTSRTSFLGVPGVSAAPVASSPGYRASFMGAPPGAAENGSTAFAQPWTKQRASSHGELGTNAHGQPRAQIRNSLLSPHAAMRATSPKPGAGPSKLSGEVDLANPALPSSKRQSVAPPIPTDADYLNSRLYQRTLKAQKALEKERAKAAAKGKTSRYDTSNLASKSTSSLTSTLGGLGMRKRSGESLRPASIMSVAGVSGSSSIRRSGRKSFGWFRSSSEAALPLSASTGSAAAANGEAPTLSTMPTSLSLPKMPAHPSRTHSNGTSSSHGAPSLLPTMPPSPNLPSEATLRSMGLSDDQIEAAAQAQGSATSVRPRLDSRQSSGGDRRASSRPPMSRESSAAHNAPPTRAAVQHQTGTQQLAPPIPAALAPPLLAVPTPPFANDLSRSTPRNALAPLAENALEVHKTRSPSPVMMPREEPPHGPVRASSLSLKPTPANVPLPGSAPSSRPSTRPPTATESVPGQQFPPSVPTGARPSEAVRQTPPMQQQQPSAPAPTLPPSATQSQKPEYHRMASSSSSGGSRTPSRTESLAVPGQAQAQGNRPAEVKRRKSGFGALFGFGGGDKSAAKPRNASGGPSASLNQSGRSHATIAERAEEKHDERPRQTLKRVDERQREPQAAAQKLSRERASSSANDANGGLFGRGKSSRPEANGRAASSSSHKSAASPPAKARKEEVPFYHPSQMLHAAEPEPQPEKARGAGPPPPGIRPINPSPMPSPRPGNGMRSFSGNGPPPQERSSGGSSSTAHESLNSSTSTFPPNKQGMHGRRSEHPHPQRPQQQQQQQQKKGAFSSLLSSYGSVRSRTRSSPTVPTTAKFGSGDGNRGAPSPSRQQQQQQQNGLSSNGSRNPSRQQQNGPPANLA